jgi:hypothetical protein
LLLLLAGEIPLGEERFFLRVVIPGTAGIEAKRR